jgi:hypothetical protein
VDKYNSCDISILPITLQNAQQQHIRTCKEKNHVIFIFHYPLPPMNITKILHPFESKEDSPFNKFSHFQGSADLEGCATFWKKLNRYLQ